MQPILVHRDNVGMAPRRAQPRFVDRRRHQRGALVPAYLPQALRAEIAHRAILYRLHARGRNAHLQDDANATVLPGVLQQRVALSLRRLPAYRQRNEKGERKGRKSAVQSHRVPGDIGFASESD